MWSDDLIFPPSMLACAIKITMVCGLPTMNNIMTIAYLLVQMRDNLWTIVRFQLDLPGV